jgi:hypothetical protein
MAVTPNPPRVRGFVSERACSQPDPLHLVLGEPLLGAVVKLGRARALMRRHLLGVLERAAVAEVAVIPGARKVWQPIGAAMPAAAARRRIMRQASG